MYPESTQSISLRLWGDLHSLTIIANQLTLDPNDYVKFKLGRHTLSHSLVVNKVSNLEYELNLFMDLIEQREIFLIASELVSSWIVISLEEFTLFNLGKDTLSRLSALKLSISFENES